MNLGKYDFHEPRRVIVERPHRVHLKNVWGIGANEDHAPEGIQHKFTIDRLGSYFWQESVMAQSLIDRRVKQSFVAGQQAITLCPGVSTIAIVSCFAESVKEHQHRQGAPAGVFWRIHRDSISELGLTGQSQVDEFVLGESQGRFRATTAACGTQSR